MLVLTSIGSETDIGDSGITIVTHSTGDNIINFADGTGEMLLPVR